jgi:hypothetical protein
MKKLTNRDFRDFGWEIAHGAVTRRPPISLYMTVPRTGGYAYDVGVWDLSIVQGPVSVAPSQTLALRFATVSSLHVGRTMSQPAAAGRRLAPSPASACVGMTVCAEPASSTSAAAGITCTPGTSSTTSLAANTQRSTQPPTGCSSPREPSACGEKGERQSAAAWSGEGNSAGEERPR